MTTVTVTKTTFLIFAVLNVLFTKNFLREFGDFRETERHPQILLQSKRLIYD